MLKNAFLLALFATLVACGGGGGDNTSTAEPTNPPPTNTLPSVNAGEDQTVVEGSEVSLEGEATDSDGSIVSYSWIQLAGESVSLTDSDKIRASFDAPDVEERVELSFQLTVTDNDDAQSSDTISIFVEPTNPAPTNTLPSVNAGEDQTVVEGSEVSLEGEATDSDGSIVSYSWIQLAGESVTLTDSDKIRASFDAPDVEERVELSFQLTVTDNDDAQSSDTISIFVEPTNPPPTNTLPSVNAGEDQTVVEGSEVSLEGEATDSDGSIVSYSWIQLAGESVTLTDSDKIRASFDAPDVEGRVELSFQLTVTDNDDAQSSDTISIFVEPTNPPPTNTLPSVNAGEDQTVVEGSEVSLEGEATDSDGSIVSYSWIQLAGESVSLTDSDKIRASFDAPDVEERVELRFQLTVTDNDDAQSSDTISIFVEPTNPPPTNTLPSVNAGEDQTVVEGSEVSLEGEATDSDGSIVSYSWIQLAGESVTLTDSDKIRASFDAPDVEERVELSFQLTVTDNDDAQSSDTISIFVEPTNPAPTNTLPSVNAGEDQTVVEGSEVSLEGEATDSDGSIVSYSWIQLAGESVTLTDSDKIRASFDAPDVEERVELSFQLTVTDNDDAQSSDTISIFVEPTNPPPTNTLPSVNAGEDQTVVEGSEVSLEGEATDSDGSIVSYSWIQLAGESISITDSDKIKASFDAPEVTYEHELILELTVTDNNGLDNSDTIAVIVIPTPADTPTKLMWPIECEPGIDCTVGYADVDGDGVAFNCENPSYQGHEGIDINLNDGPNTTKWEQMDKGVNVLAAQSGVVLWAFDDETAFDKCTENTDIAECNAPTEQNGPNVSSGYRVCTDLGNYCAGGAGLCYWCFDGKNVVVIKHEGEVFATRYDHLKSGSVLVEKGDTVSRGQKIAEVGSAGRSTGPHLHFEVWETDYYSLGEPFAGKCGPNFENSLWNLNKFPWFVK